MVVSPQEAQGWMLTTDTFSPLHRRTPASHSLMVCVDAVSSSPTRTHTFMTGFKQSASSLQRQLLVDSNKTNVEGLMKRLQMLHNAKFCLWFCSYHHISPTCGRSCSPESRAEATRSCCTRLFQSSSYCTSGHAFCIQSWG